MKSILRATAVLSMSSAVLILCGVVSAKAWALLLGPSGLGQMNLLQSLLGLASIIAGLGVGTAIVREGAHAIALRDHVGMSALRRGAWFLFWVSTTVAILIMTVFRGPISRWAIGGPEHGGKVLVIGLALLFNMAVILETSILNAYQRVGALAKIGIFKGLLGTLIGIVVVWIWRENGIAPALVAYSASGWFFSHYFLRQTKMVGNPSRREALKAASLLLRFGIPFTASMLVGAGVQLALPVLVLRSLGIESVGFYAAAATVALGYVGFLLNSMAQDYYPRVSAASHEPAALVNLINQQHRVVMLVAVPMILGLVALVRYIVPLLYSSQFHPAVELLEWQLIGDLLKFSAWTMSFVVLARSGSTAFFLTELAGGVTLMLTSWLGMRSFGLAGLGVAFLITSLVYYLVVIATVRRTIGFRWTIENKVIISAALLAALVVRLVPIAGLERLRTPLALFFATLAGLGSLYVVWKEMRAPKPSEASSN